MVTGSRTVTAEGLSNKEIMRCLKRYIAREVYPTSAAPLTDSPDSGGGLTIKVWRDADGTWWRKGSVLTLVLWGVLIAARGLP